MDDQRQALELLLGHLLGHLDEAFDHDAWHGGTLWGSIRGTSREDAEWRPSPSRHNVREIVVHCAYWKYIRFQTRLIGRRRRRQWWRCRGAPGRRRILAKGRINGASNRVLGPPPRMAQTPSFS